MLVLDRSTRRRLGLVAALIVLVAACTGDERSDNSPTTQRADTSTTSGSGLATEDGPPDTTTTVTPATSQPGTIAEYEALWKRQRQAIIDRLNDDAYKIDDDGVVRGPGGMSLDTRNCPPNWSDTQGIDGGSVTLVQLAPLSALTTIGELGLGTRQYFEQLNANGGIGPDGLLVDVVVVDDGYVPEQTARLVDGFLDGAEPFALSTIGTLNLDAVNDRLNEACVPLLMGSSPSPIWADPEGHPWTTGLRMAQTTEALLWLRWIERNFNEPVRVAALVMDNTFGHTYQQAFAEAAAGSDDIERFDAVSHDPTSPSVTAEMAQIAGLEPDVFISMTADNPCLFAIEEAASVGLADHASIRFTPSVCAQSNSYVKPAHRAGHDWLVVGGGTKDPTADEWAEDPWISYVNRELAAAGIDITNGQQAEGYGLRGWAIHQVLEIAANLDGGLTRTNLVLAQRGLAEMTHPMLYPGIAFAMSGNRDGYLIEGSQVARYDADSHSWIVSEVIDLDGQTPSCAWQSEGGCSPAN